MWEKGGEYPADEWSKKKLGFKTCWIKPDLNWAGADDLSALREGNGKTWDRLALSSRVVGARHVRPASATGNGDTEQ